MRVAGFDLASNVGAADGEPSGKPRTWSWNLGKPGVSRPEKLGRLLRYAERYFSEYRPDALFYEKGLPLGAAFQIGMSEDTVALLRGAIGILEACAARAGVARIEGVEVQKARRHLVGRERLAAGTGKEAVWKMCRVLGWPVTDMDQSDAAAIWAYGGALMNPRLAHLSTPLFAS
jgi:hypothetical protein